MEQTLHDIARISWSRSSPILVDSVYATTRNFSWRIIAGYTTPSAWTFDSILERIIQANISLQKEHKLQFIIKDAYRPRQASEYMNVWAQEQWRYAELVPKFIGLPGKSQHNNASAIDLTFATAEGQEIWMGSIFDEFNEYAHQKYHRNITTDDDFWAKDGKYTVLSEPIENIRALLRSTLESINLLPYDEEWWHFYEPTIVLSQPLERESV